MTDGHGGKREGAGRKPNSGSKRQSGARVGALLAPEVAATLRDYPQTRALELLASGLELGASNVGELDAGEVALLGEALRGTFLEALTVRLLPDEVRALGTLEAAQLADRMATWGDWELLHVTLRYGLR